MDEDQQNEHCSTEPFPIEELPEAYRLLLAHRAKTKEITGRIECAKSGCFEWALIRLEWNDS